MADDGVGFVLQCRRSPGEVQLQSGRIQRVIERAIDQHIRPKLFNLGLRLGVIHHNANRRIAGRLVDLVVPNLDAQIGTGELLIESFRQPAAQPLSWL